MIPKQAVEKAIEGGWRSNAIKWSLRDPKDERESLKFTPASYQEMEKAKKYDHWKDWILVPVYDYDVVSQELPLIAIDPTFWQALGKATDPERYEGSGVYNGEAMPRYLCKAMCFYSLILTGGDTEKFWKELLDTKLRTR